jgi:hypothetical protein
MFETDV